jgi:ribosomal protein L19
MLFSIGMLMPITSTSNRPAVASETRAIFDELKPGDRIEVEHTVTVGRRNWPAKTAGTVVRTERRRHGMHFRRNFDDKVYSDTILLELPDGELTAITVDEFTTLRRA